jgi:hypothetical protein
MLIASPCSPHQHSETSRHLTGWRQTGRGADKPKASSADGRSLLYQPACATITRPVVFGVGRETTAPAFPVAGFILLGIGFAKPCIGQNIEPG